MCKWESNLDSFIENAWREHVKNACEDFFIYTHSGDENEEEEYFSEREENLRKILKKLEMFPILIDDGNVYRMHFTKNCEKCICGFRIFGYKMFDKSENAILEYDFEKLCPGCFLKLAEMLKYEIDRGEKYA